MMPTPGVRLSSRDGPRSSPDIGSSQGSQSMPIPDGPDEDLNEDALPDGFLPDLPPGWIMPTAKGNNVFFERFRTLVKWDPAHEEQVKVLFHSKASKRLSDIFNQARKKNKRPSWIGPELWETLLALFDIPEEKKQARKGEGKQGFN
ncbi:hypothetical protein RIF29_09841 [Crotalaria pallida]|uniref:Uncharacterized protein n=1 Tax=Crotalaria pallida TaxID=3830 RepID=A0AAN9FS94_CROPI